MWGTTNSTQTGRICFNDTHGHKGNEERGSERGTEKFVLRVLSFGLTHRVHPTLPSPFPPSLPLLFLPPLAFCPRCACVPCV